MGTLPANFGRHGPETRPALGATPGSMPARSRESASRPARSGSAGTDVPTRPPCPRAPQHFQPSPSPTRVAQDPSRGCAGETACRPRHVAPARGRQAGKPPRGRWACSRSTPPQTAGATDHAAAPRNATLKQARSATQQPTHSRRSASPTPALDHSRTRRNAAKPRRLSFVRRLRAVDPARAPHPLQRPSPGRWTSQSRSPSRPAGTRTLPRKGRTRPGWPLSCRSPTSCGSPPRARSMAATRPKNGSAT